MTTENTEVSLKQQKLRNNEYYNIQTLFDKLYDKSKKGYNFKKLYDLIIDDNNILLAYRNIKKNKGSHTPGTNGKTIEDLGKMSTSELINMVKHRLHNYRPGKVKRVHIPKTDGKTRPLGIPTIEDRLIQQCIKQILEPICEAKFHPHSYGFRPNRNTSHAIARANFLIFNGKMRYAVDIDIKGFFDNVSHGKLLKQMWALGIRDKKVLSIISKMLKAEIENEGIPTKGTPQGGILSPLLSNIVLNELDWWISDQWETFKTKKNYHRLRKNGAIETSNRIRAQRDSTNLKNMWIVRYADDFKILCIDQRTAEIMYHATKHWLQERLGLEISEQKSKIVNLRRNYSEFLGFRLKAANKNGKDITRSRITEKAKKNIALKMRSKIKQLRDNPGVGSAYDYNATVLGLHNYYSSASLVSDDFNDVWNKIRFQLHHVTKIRASKKGNKTKTYMKYYGDYKYNVFISEVPIFPFYGISFRPPSYFNQEICNYTQEGRERVHKALSKDYSETIYHLMSTAKYNSSELSDNKISLFVGQNGLCSVTKQPLTIGNMEVHHVKPKELGGTDEYGNLTFVVREVHKIIHATQEDTINKYIKILHISNDEKVLKKINKLRTLVGNNKIAI